ncbi:hypothetical protein [Streptomyces alanosinicus]|uniref:Serine/threonine protein kinase n=1 Tax=Streptomyces alanosinicus TaxID=68171 RepID=A0A918YTA1_9ACTN|nr:hypothetical protein [Streptomyces alanosinicus]GHE14408.1 hypothetical protein GCM10010339_84980 [Streptomyces alanosinicus]
MTTATTVAGRPLSGWSRHTRHGTWHALLPARSGERTLGALRVDRALLAPEGTRERLAAVVLATARLRLPGLLGTVDLVAETGEVWLLTARPPAPTLADVLSSANGPRPDAGSVASILNETAQTLLALHTAGLTHGSLGPDTVVIAPDGVALLAEAELGMVLGDAAAVPVPGDTPHADRQAVATTAWAALARTLGAAWTQPGTPAADLFARCSDTAESEGLAAARAELVAGRAALPADFLRRTALRAATAAVTPEFAPPKTPQPSAAVAPGRQAPRTDSHQALTTTDPAPRPTAPEDPAAAPDRSSRPSATAGQPATVAHAHRSAGPDPQALLVAPGPHPPAIADQLTTVGRARRSTAPDTQATVLGKRNRVTLPPVAAGEDSGGILLRFGPGVPVEEQDVLRARWRTEASVPASPRSRRGRRGWIVTTAVTTAIVAIAVVLLWLLLRPAPAPAVVAVRVQAPAGPLHCGQTADLIGVITTDGHGGPVTYRWLRADGQDSGELVRTAHRGERRVRVHLRWTVRGPGRFRGTARLRIAHRPAPMEAEASFTYVCP